MHELYPPPPLIISDLNLSCLDDLLLVAELDLVHILDERVRALIIRLDAGAHLLILLRLGLEELLKERVLLAPLLQHVPLEAPLRREVLLLIPLRVLPEVLAHLLLLCIGEEGRWPRPPETLEELVLLAVSGLRP